MYINCIETYISPSLKKSILAHCFVCPISLTSTTISMGLIISLDFCFIWSSAFSLRFMKMCECIPYSLFIRRLQIMLSLWVFLLFSEYCSSKYLNKYRLEKILLIIVIQSVTVKADSGNEWKNKIQPPNLTHHEVPYHD